MSLLTVAAVTLHTLPLDFTANRDAILEGIRDAKARGATVITTPELSIPGYGALDHHLEADTFLHSWEMMAQIIADPVCKDVLVDAFFSMVETETGGESPMLQHSPETTEGLSGGGIVKGSSIVDALQETYYLEDIMGRVTGQKVVDIGDGIVSTVDSAIGTETCEELFVPNNPSIGQGLNGAEVISNSSASHAQLRKLRQRLDLIANSTRKLGGIYIYSNMTGVDGEARQMFDGSSMIILNGKVLAQSSQFSLKRVEVITATVDLEEVRSYRSSISRNLQAAAQPEYPRIEAGLRLSRPVDEIFLSGGMPISKEIDIQVLDPMAEIWKSTGVWLWQYLTITNSAGFLLPLSGGADSCTTALMVFGMAILVVQSIEEGDERVLADARRITGEKDFIPQRPQDLVARIFHTVYMGTVNSGKETRSRAARLASQIGAFHSDTNCDDAVNAHEAMIQQTLGLVPKYTVAGGSNQENLAKQNIQARSRMVFAYSLAQLSTTARNTARKGAALLVLSSANVDECLRGYLTKYDCSSADINPLGSISKTDVRRFAQWARNEWKLSILDEFISAVPTAELLPLSAGIQSDEEEMGLSYEELSVFGLLRKVDKLGPWGAYLRLLGDWKEKCTPRETAEKTMRFYKFYAMNRHKSTVLTPALHLSAYNPDDNRHDLRPFLYVINWPWQFGKIQQHVDQLEARMGKKTVEGD